MNYRELIKKEIEDNKEEIIALGRKIHQNPELGKEEYFAAAEISSFFEKNGFIVERGLGGMKTAFSACLEGNEEGPTVAFLAEYDALPEMGHACGHNLIAVGSIGAALGLKALALGFSGKIYLIGTPAEENMGGKVELLEAGIFDNIDCAMMFHPGFENKVEVEALAIDCLKFVFKGKAVHAASEPEEGINALDGIIQTFNSINALREHVRDDVRIHGIIREGGVAANIVPERAVGEFFVRSLDRAYLDEITEKVKNCARGAALATGCKLDIDRSSHSFDNMINNKVLAGQIKQELIELGITDFESRGEGLGSIDMGNVSQQIPAIHPVLAITDDRVPAHTAEFARLSNSSRGYEVAITAAKALALTAWKVLCDEDFMEKVKENFKKNS